MPTTGSDPHVCRSVELMSIEPTTTMQPGVMDTTPTDAEAEAGK